MREETEKLKIAGKNWLDREQYGKKLKETRFLWKIKKNGSVQEGSKGTQKWWEDSGIREKRKREMKSNYIRVDLKGSFVEKKKSFIGIIIQ